MDKALLPIAVTAIAVILLTTLIIRAKGHVPSTARQAATPRPEPGDLHPWIRDLVVTEAPDPVRDDGNKLLDEGVETQVSRQEAIEIFKRVSTVYNASPDGRVAAIHVHPHTGRASLSWDNDIWYIVPASVSQPAQA